jgi:hypothetical protein
MIRGQKMQRSIFSDVWLAPFHTASTRIRDKGQASIVHTRVSVIVGLENLYAIDQAISP